MNFSWRNFKDWSQDIIAAGAGGLRKNAARGIFALCALGALLGSALLLSQAASQTPSSSQAAASGAPAQALTDAQMARMSSDQLAHYVFEHHGCNGCHTLGANGKLGFTERGKTVGKGFEGCISLLTSMNVIAQVKETNRTEDEKHKAARFKEFGCTTCHQITPGKLGLTAYGTKLKSFHMACTDVEKILSQQK
jgi:cytochrome c2